MEIGIHTFASANFKDKDGNQIPGNQAINELLDRIEYADKIGIDEVGIGEHHQDQYNTDLYGYLVKSLCDPEEQSIINYINNNRHNPDRDYNLSYIYSSTLSSKNGNFN